MGQRALCRSESNNWDMSHNDKKSQARNHCRGRFPAPEHPDPEHITQSTRLGTPDPEHRDSEHPTTSPQGSPQIFPWEIKYARLWRGPYKSPGGVITWTPGQRARLTRRKYSYL